MTEEEWMNATKPFTCKQIARDFGTARKLRLLMVGLLEPLEKLMSSEARGVFEMLRDWAEDEKASIDEDRPWSEPEGPLRDYMEWTIKGRASDSLGWVLHHGSRIEPRWTYSVAMPAAELSDKIANAIALAKVGSSPKGGTPKDAAHQQWSQAWNEAIQASHRQNANIMRCVYGNPFRPVSFEKSFANSGVRLIAGAIYDERSFDRLAALAEALEKAGCDNSEVLHHCRQPGPHVRGCWVVDMLLGKE